MRSFLKILLACFVAIILTLGILFFLGFSLVNKASQPDVPTVKSKTILVIDLSKPIEEQRMPIGLSIPEGTTPEAIGLFDIIRSIQQAKTDSLIKGIYVFAQGNRLGYASSTELRNALQDFKTSGKFVYAVSDFYSQRAYEVANVADSIFCYPYGLLDWKGYQAQLVFFKSALDKLGVAPEVFYAGKFKSATEPFRLDKMSEPNRQQMTEFIEELYQQFLTNTAKSRTLDTAFLRNLAVNLTIRNARDAQQAGLIDGVLYNDQVHDHLKALLDIKEDDKINFMPISDYIKTGKWDDNKAHDKIAIIYASGEIMDGKGQPGQIGGDQFRTQIRNARIDKDVKAVVLRVNSPGGSSFASEEIWRELLLCKKEKPLVVSMSDYAASGGYYISCVADSIYAQPNTLTGSIGVFTIFFNAQELMNNKLGISFDNVKTAPYADYGDFTRPMTEKEKAYTQADVDSVYLGFKQRVAEGRKLSLEFVDSIAQGRIWSGRMAKQLKLVDQIGGLQDALDCAARMAKLKDYKVIELPEVKSFWEKLLAGNNDADKAFKAAALKNQLSEDEYAWILQLSRIKNWSGVPQMRLPFLLSSE